MLKVLVIGGATWDVLLQTSEAQLTSIKYKGGRHAALAFLYGAKIDATGGEYSFGGGAANVAVGLNRLGVAADIHTRLGNDWRAKEIIKHLHKERVGTRLVQFDDKLTSAVAVVITSGKAHEHILFVDRGASINFIIDSQLSRAGYDWSYITSLANNNWPRLLLSFLQSSKRRGQKIFWNPGANQLKNPSKVKTLLKYVTVLDLNYDEAKELLGLGGKSVQIKDLLCQLYQLGPKIILVTAGQRGAYAYDGHNLIHQPSFNIKPVNTIGAGDSFGSGWLAGYIQSRGDLSKAMFLGMCNSNSVILNTGAQKGLLFKNNLAKFIKKYAKTKN